MGSKGIKPTLFTFTELINALAKSGELAPALKVYREMQANGVNVSVVTYGALLEACVRANDADAAIDLYAEMWRLGVEPNDLCYNLLIRACSCSGRLDRIVDIMRRLGAGGGRIQHETYEAVVRALCRAQMPERALRVTSWMRSNNHVPTSTTMAALVEACCADGQVEWAFQTYKRMLEAGHAPQRSASNAVIGALLGAAQVDRALQVYDDILNHQPHQVADPTTLCLLVTHCSRGFQLTRAMQYYELLQNTYFRPKRASLGGSGRELRAAGWGLGTPLSNDSMGITTSAEGWASDADVMELGKMYGFLIEAHCRRTSLEDALQVFDDMKNHQHPPMKVQVTTLAFLESMCRRTPGFELRVYDVCAQVCVWSNVDIPFPNHLLDPFP